MRSLRCPHSEAKLRTSSCKVDVDPDSPCLVFSRTGENSWTTFQSVLCCSDASSPCKVVCVPGIPVVSSESGFAKDCTWTDTHQTCDERNRLQRQNYDTAVASLHLKDTICNLTVNSIQRKTPVENSSYTKTRQLRRIEWCRRERDTKKKSSSCVRIDPREPAPSQPTRCGDSRLPGRSVTSSR